MKAIRILSKVVAAVLLAAGLLALIVRFNFVRQYGPTASRLKLELHAAKDDGIPLVPADLQPERAIRDSENAAPLYRRIDGSFRARSKAEQAEDGRVFDLAQSRNPEDRDLARKILIRRSRELALAEEAANRQFCWFDRPWQEGPNVLFPEFATMRQLARLLASRAILLGADGDLEAAFKSINTGAKMGRHVGQDPIVIGLLVNLGLYAMMDKAFQHVVLENQEDTSLPASVQEAAEFPHLPSLQHSFSGEVVMGRVSVQLIRDMRTATDIVVGLLARNVPWVRQLMCDAWETRILEYWRKCFHAIRPFEDDPIAQANSVKELGVDAQSHTSDPTYTFVEILMPVFSTVALKRAFAIEQERLRRTLIALVDYKQSNRVWPKSLKDLEMSPEPDIFTNRPPIYRRTETGFILYSVGDDMQDDGGRKKKDEKTGALDMVIQYPLTK